jgi:tetratricopeptide (TPR) repeat protein
MPTFLWSGKNAAGVEEADRITADTPEAARKVLEERGWTELRLHTTDIHNFVQEQIRASSPPERQPNLTAKEELSYVKGTSPGFFSRWSKALTESWGIALAMAVVIAWAIFRGNRTDWVVSLILLVLLLAMFFLHPVLELWFRQTGREFRRLTKANTWHRWAEVLECLDGLERAQKNTQIGIGDANKARYRARALVGMGRLDEGLELFRVSSEAAKTPAWLYHTFQAGLYRLVKQDDKARELYRQALEEATDKTIVLIDTAAFLVERYNRPAEAREFLAQAEKCQLSELAIQFLPGVRGKIAYREKDYATADKLLRQGLAGYENQPRKKAYIFEGSILTAKAYLAVCNAALGNKEAARKFFRDAEPFMKAVEMDELLAHYESVMGKN